MEQAGWGGTTLVVLTTDALGLRAEQRGVTGFQGQSALFSRLNWLFGACAAWVWVCYPCICCVGWVSESACKHRQLLMSCLVRWATCLQAAHVWDSILPLEGHENMAGFVGPAVNFSRIWLVRAACAWEPVGLPLAVQGVVRGGLRLCQGRV